MNTIVAADVPIASGSTWAVSDALALEDFHQHRHDREAATDAEKAREKADERAEHEEDREEGEVHCRESPPP